MTRFQRRQAALCLPDACVVTNRGLLWPMRHNQEETFDGTELMSVTILYRPCFAGAWGIRQNLHLGTTVAEGLLACSGI